MIALDSSALIAVATKEPDWEIFRDMLVTMDCLVGAPTLLETHMVLSSFKPLDPTIFLQTIRNLPNLDVVAFDHRHLDQACLAFDRYGKGRNAASSLNYGDCLAYAVAKVAGIPLLFKGQDFHATDIQPAIAP